MAKIVLGMDGGGTKTHCALFDREGNRIGQIDWGPTNHECLAGGFAELRTELGRLIDDALQACGAEKKDLGRCVFGLAGVDTRRQHGILSEMIRSFGIDDFLLCNDSVLGVKAGCPGGAGICAVNGTGFSVGGIDPTGRMLQFGGQGDLTGDYGGGGFIARQGIAAAYRALFVDRAGSVLADGFFRELGIDCKEDFLETLLDAAERGERRISDLNRIVFQAALAGDPAAAAILENMGLAYARAIGAVIDGLCFPRETRLDIVLAGSLFVRGESPAAIRTLETAVRGRYPDREIVFSILRHPPVAGAVLWALEGTGATGLFEKVTGQFR